ncbi:hypothetical protein GQ44DRAFT_605035 [Phaeosphaeriaceae sp. PMI808]|nr:hypothetical protein GQ44DRAFT_605035 [Phaeosphaeriaceae sp. PMI808]
MSQNTALCAFRTFTRTFRPSRTSWQPSRCLSQTSPTTAATPPPTTATPPTPSPPPPSPNDPSNQEKSLETLMSTIDSTFHRASPDYFANLIPGQTPTMHNLTARDWEEDDKHKLHIYSTKHNTHITLSKPNHDALISVSCGNIGFRKAGRGSYDAAYQLAAFVMSRIQDKGLLPQIQKLELVFRGFGSGREAVAKAIMGSEGKRIRGLIVKLSDSTRLKFGGVRSKKPRRLG